MTFISPMNITHCNFSLALLPSLQALPVPNSLCTPLKPNPGSPLLCLLHFLKLSSLSLSLPLSLLSLSLSLSPFSLSLSLSLSVQRYSGNFRPSLTSQTSCRSVEQWNPWFIAQIISYVPLEDGLQRLLSHYKHLCTHAHAQICEWAMSAGEILVTRGNMSQRVLRAPDEDEERI